MKLNQIRIRTRLGISAGMLLLLMGVCIALTFSRFQDLQAINERMIEEDWAKAEAANLINATTRANARRTMELLIVSEAAQVAHVKSRISENKKLIDDALVTLDKLVRRPDGRAMLEELKQRRVAYVKSFTQVAQLVDRGEREAATQLMSTETLPRLDALQQPVESLARLQRTIMVASSEEVRSSIRSAKLLMLAVGLAALVSGALLAWRISRSITEPMNEAVELARTVAKGDLSTHFVVEGKDETGQLLRELSTMTDRLQAIVHEVRTSADEMATASREIAQGNLDLSARTEEQASALEETAASMEQLASAVKNNDESSQYAAKLAESAANVAAKGGDLVGKIVHTMEAINTSSKRIADIIGLIDGIAFQTNILALNAAVEAARAGEQGRGFAVVAGEVRNLAQRSAAAAKEIKTLIGESVGNVNEGCTLVEQAGSTMDEIVVHVRRVADLMREITTANHEQSCGIEQVNQAVGQMDQVTQENAALVEEAAAAAQALDERAAGLIRSVSVFQLRHAPATRALRLA